MPTDEEIDKVYEEHNLAILEAGDKVGHVQIITDLIAFVHKELDAYGYRGTLLSEPNYFSPEVTEDIQALAELVERLSNGPLKAEKEDADNQSDAAYADRDAWESTL